MELRPDAVGQEAPGKARLRFLAATVALVIAARGGAAQAHHSFAVFFSSDKDVSAITGTVRAFRYTNPHGAIEIVVPAKGKPDTVWNVETNSPSVLNRRGWSRDSLKVGEVVTIEGWRARDGSNWMRLRNAIRADGSPIGTAAAPQAETAPTPAR